MSKSILYMSMSLDGFIAAADDGPDLGLGRDGMVLHEWLGPWEGDSGSFNPPGASKEVFDESMRTGATVVGRNTFEYSGEWGGDHHDGVPIFVPTRGEAGEPISEHVHYVTDGVESAMRQAKEAAGDKDVMVHGADLAQSLIMAGVLDEIQIHLVPIILGEGRPLFEHLGDRVELEIKKVVEGPGVTHLRYAVKS